MIMARRISPEELAPSSSRRAARRVSPEELAPTQPARVSASSRQVTEGPAGQAPRQVTEGPAAQRRATPRTVGEAAGVIGRGARGAGEAALAIGTGAGASSLAGLAGIQEGLRTGAAPGAAAQRVQDVQQQLTFQPRTPEGQAALGGVARAFEPLEVAARRAGEVTTDVTGSPLAGTAVSTAIEAAPMGAGVRGAPRGLPGARTQVPRQLDIERVQAAADELGIDLNTSSLRQREQIGTAAERMAPGERGEALPVVQDGLVKAANEARDVKNQLYAEAESKRAGVPVEQVTAEFLPGLRRATQDFLVEDMPVVRKMLNRAESIQDQPPGSIVQINAMERWRKQINRNRPPRSDRAQNAALDVMQGQLDSFLDTKFNADMISGDPDAINAWRRARAANQSYRERFSDNKVIRDMVEIEATPETMRQWIFGASTVGAKKEAGAVVRRIKNELGEDSPPMQALRQDALLDILDPLLRPEPDLQAFVKNHDRFVAKNPTLARELFPDNISALNSLRDFAKSTAGRPGVVLSELPGFSRVLGVAAFGHGIARGALRVRAATTAAQGLTRVIAKTPKRRAMGEILGYDPFAPMFGGRAAVIGGGTQAATQQEPRQPPEVGVRTPRAGP